MPHSPVLTSSSSHWFLRMDQDKTWHLLTSAVHYMHVRPSITLSIFNQYCPSWCLTHGRLRTKPCGFNRTHIIKPSEFIECLFYGFKRIEQPKNYISVIAYSPVWLSFFSFPWNNIEFHERKKIQVWNDMRLLFFLYFQYFSVSLILSLLSFLITALFLQLPFFLSAMRAFSCLNLSGAFRGNKLWAGRVSAVTSSSHKPFLSFSQLLCLCNRFLVDSERLREWDSP